MSQTGEDSNYTGGGAFPERDAPLISRYNIIICRQTTCVPRPDVSGIHLRALRSEGASRREY